MTPKQRPFSWWFLAESAARQLRVPADVTRSDAAVERLAEDSSLYAAGRSLGLKARRAWIDSRTAIALEPVLRDFGPLTLVDWVRVSGIIAIAGSLTALVLQAVEPMRTGWLASILPAAIAAAGVIIVTLAEPISRAMADRRASRGHSSSS